MLTQATHLSQHKHSLSQDGSSERSRQKMGHLSSIYCAHTSDTSITAQTNTAYHKMGHLIRSRQKMGHLSSILCSHKRHIYHSTNKHSLSQDGSSDKEPPKDGTSQQHTVLTQATHLTAQTNTAYHKMGHLIGAKMGHLSSILCSHKRHI